MPSCKCDVCGKELIIGTCACFAVRIAFQIGIPGRQGVRWKTALDQSFGPYDPEKIYHICCECWLRSLGVKAPVIEKEG